MRTPVYLSLAFLCAATLSGCRRPSSFLSPGGGQLDSQHLLEEARQQMETIPPPMKSKYLSVHSLSDWQNPYLTVQGGMLTLHVLAADANTSTLGEGGLLRPVGARRQDLNIRIGDLATALDSIPETSWPYGRVVAVEEAHNTPPQAMPQIRRDLESTIKILNELGVVVYDWTDNAPSSQ